MRPRYSVVHRLVATVTSISVVATLHACSESAPLTFSFSKEALRDLADEAKDLLERHVGDNYEEAPNVRAVTYAELEEAATREFKYRLFIMSTKNPHIDMAQIEDYLKQAKPRLSSTARSVYGYYSVSSNTIYLVPEYFKKEARNHDDEIYLSTDFVRRVILHEMVHAMDQHLYSAVTRTFLILDADSVKAYKVILEGHAEYVTQNILSGSKDRAIHRAFAKCLRESNEERTNTYRTGYAFFRALERRKVKGLAQRVFVNPPSSMDQVKDPNSYSLRGP